MYFSDSVRYISTKSDGMRVNVKFNDFTVRKLKPNIFDNYQLIEAAATAAQQQQQQKQQKSHIKDESDDHVTEGSPETGNTHFISFCSLVKISPPFCLLAGSYSPNNIPNEDEKMDDSDDDEENRLCEWAGCNQTHQGLQGLVQHVNSSHVQV